MDEPRTVLTGMRILVWGVLAVVVAGLIAGGGYSTSSEQAAALCVALGGVALIIAGGIELAAERSRRL